MKGGWGGYHPTVLSVATMIGHLHEPVDTSFSRGVSKQARKAEVTLGTHKVRGPCDIRTSTEHTQGASRVTSVFISVPPRGAL